MKKILSLLALVTLCVVGMNAGTVKYALSTGDAFTSGQTVEVKNGDNVVATITYGESGGADFKAAKDANYIEGYTAFTEGNGTNGNKTGGTFYTITPKVDAKIAVAVVLNGEKPFYVYEDGTVLAGYDGITKTEKFYGTFEFNATAGKAYKFYCAGSKLGFFGFEMTFEDPVVITNKSIILVPGVWNTADATFAAYAFNSDEDNAWFPFAEVSGAFATQVPDNFAKIILVRLKPATDGTFNADNNGLNWDNKWNQTDDIDFTAIADQTIFTITDWGEYESPSPYTISNPLQEAREKLTKVIAMAEMLDAEAMAKEIAAAKAAVAGTDIEAMQTAMNAIMDKAMPLAQNLMSEAEAFANKYGYTEVSDAITALKAAIPAAMGGNFEPLETALTNLMTVAIPAAQDAIGKFKGYAEVLDDANLNTAVANAEAALASGKFKNIIAAVKAAEAPFMNAANAFVEKVKAENIEDDNVKAALAAVVAAASVENPSIVAVGSALQNLIKAYNAYQLELNPVFTVAGTADLTGSDWDNTKNEMKKNEETGLYEWTAKFVTVNNEQKPEFKVVRNHNWDTCWPENNWVITPEVLSGEGLYKTITITFNAETKEIAVTGVKRETPTFAADNVYFWQSPDGYEDQNGGVAVHNNGGRVNYAQAGYWTICLNGKNDFSSDIVTITLNEGVTLKAGDEIAITAFRNKDETGKTSGAKLKFDDGSTITTGDGSEFVNINEAVKETSEYGTEPNTITVKVVPESGEGSKTIQMTRSYGGTNLFITKIEINRPTSVGITSIAAEAQSGKIFNLNGQQVKSLKKGLYIINGKKQLVK